MDGDQNEPATRGPVDQETAGDAGLDVQWSDDFPKEMDRSDQADIWDTYVRNAKEHDKDMIDGWKDGINALLLFTGLFSTILSVFLLTAWAALQPDNGQATVNGLVAISRQLATGTTEPNNASTVFVAPPFSPPNWALWVNGLWFISLFLSLSTAVLAMLIMEWLVQYNVDTPPGKIQRTHQRQFRYNGIQKWHVAGFMGFLPLSIHVSVFLFLAGLVIFVGAVNLAISRILLAMLSCGGVLYIASAIRPLLNVQCPYKSALYRMLDYLRRWVLNLKLYRLHLAGRVLLSLRTCNKYIWHVRLKKGKPALQQQAQEEWDTWLNQWHATRDGVRARKEPEQRAIEERQVELKALAMGYMCAAPDPAAQKTALLVLAGWNIPTNIWPEIKADVQSAAECFVSNGMALALQERKRPNIVEMRQMALISKFCKQREQSGRYMLHSFRDLVFAATPSPNTRSNFQIRSTSLQMGTLLLNLGNDCNLPSVVLGRASRLSLCDLCTALQSYYLHKTFPIPDLLDDVATFFPKVSPRLLSSFLACVSLQAETAEMRGETFDCVWEAIPGSARSLGLRMVSCLELSFASRGALRNPRQDVISNALLNSLITNSSAFDIPSRLRAMVILCESENAEDPRKIQAIAAAGAGIESFSNCELSGILVWLHNINSLAILPSEDAISEACRACTVLCGSAVAADEHASRLHAFIENGGLEDILLKINATTGSNKNDLCGAAIAVFIACPYSLFDDQPKSIVVDWLAMMQDCGLDYMSQQAGNTWLVGALVERLEALVSSGNEVVLQSCQLVSRRYEAVYLREKQRYTRGEGRTQQNLHRMTPKDLETLHEVIRPATLDV